MTTKQAKSILSHPDKIFVLTALSFVNLTDKENTTLILRYMRGHTQRETARELMQAEHERSHEPDCAADEYSVNCVQKIEAKALQKCCKVWEHMAIIKAALDF